MTDWTLYDTAYTERYLGLPDAGKSPAYASAHLPSRAALLDRPLLLVHGSISRALAPTFVERLQRLAQDFAAQHLADQKLDEAQREGYTLVLAMREWEFGAFTQLRRPREPQAAGRAGTSAPAARRA